MSSTPLAAPDAIGVPRGVAEWEFDLLMRGVRGPGPAAATPLDVVSLAIDDAITARRDANRAMARYVSAVTEAVQVARANPHTYLTEAGLQARDAAELAERAAATDAALQLGVTPHRVRNDARLGGALRERLPQLGAKFASGIIGYAQARTVVDAVAGLTDHALLDQYDTELAAEIDALTESTLRRRARRLAKRLRTESPETRHARALAERRVSVEDADDGMSWVHALVSAADAMRIKARLDATARSIQKGSKAAGSGDPRTRDQIRADLFACWLAGDGTPSAARVRPLVFIPLLSLLGKSDQPAILQGYGEIDDVTAAQLFLDAPAFSRVATDPFTGEVLDYDRTRYRPTAAQREKLAAIFGTCGRDGCDRLATECDLDHLDEWHRDGGPTNEANLLPLCPADHRLKTLTKIRYEREDDGSITVETPTGHRSRRRPSPPLPDLPPF